MQYVSRNMLQNWLKKATYPVPPPGLPDPNQIECKHYFYCEFMDKDTLGSLNKPSIIAHNMTIDVGMKV